MNFRCKIKYNEKYDWWIFPSFHKKISKNLCLYFNKEIKVKIYIFLYIFFRYKYFRNVTFIKSIKEIILPLFSFRIF